MKNIPTRGEFLSRINQIAAAKKAKGEKAYQQYLADRAVTLSQSIVRGICTKFLINFEEGNAFPFSISVLVDELDIAFLDEKQIESEVQKKLGQEYPVSVSLDSVDRFDDGDEWYIIANFD